ncbi:hypothetical protein B0H13DRAFT_2652412 [Mycena leptocephala]|nr:hypothetical protein B0H13DRAFT_2652412 [Mycena leptocephala]
MSCKNGRTNGLYNVSMDEQAKKDALNIASKNDANGFRNSFKDGHNSCENSQTGEDRLSPAIASAELYSDLTKVDVDFEAFFLIGKPRKVLPKFTLKLTPLTYLPKVDNPRRDWVSSVAVPAFLTHRAQNTVRAFATIGTGAGLDAIAAVDIFDLEHVAITDLHQAVVDAAAENIRTATAGLGVNLIAAAGDILALWQVKNANTISSTKTCRIFHCTSATYVPRRAENIPSIATENLLALHFLALCQAKPLLSATGAVLSSIGGRVSIDILLEMAFEAGYSADILTYTWKIQSEPEEVIGGYKKNQEDGHGPFYFYPAAVLEEAFRGLEPAVAGTQAKEIEKALLDHRVDATVAYELHKNGLVMGHTVVIVQSTPLESVA